MALVDRRYLYRPRGTSVLGLAEMAETCFSQCFSGYVGHYVLITGYDAAAGGYFVSDPAKPSGRAFVHARDLDTARRSHGTDEDLIVIPLGQPAPTPPDPSSLTGVTTIASSTAASSSAAAGAAAEGDDALGTVAPTRGRWR